MTDTPKNALFAWMLALEVTDEKSGVHFVHALAKVATSAVGRRLDDPDTGLVLDPVTLGDRQMAAQFIFLVAAAPLYRDHAAARRARALVQTDTLWEAFTSINADTPPGPDPGM